MLRSEDLLDRRACCRCPLIRQRIDLCTNRYLFSLLFERLRHQSLSSSIAIQRGRVDEKTAAIQGLVKRGKRLLFWLWSPAPANRPGTDPHTADRDVLFSHESHCLFHRIRHSATIAAPFLSLLVQNLTASVF